MLKHILMIIMTAGILAGTNASSSASAIPQPYVVYHGKALNAAIGDTITVKLNSGTLDPKGPTCKVGGGKKYELWVPIEDSNGTRMSNTSFPARKGDTLTIYIQNVLVANGTVVVPAFGTTVPLDLGTRTAQQWALDHPGDDGSGDKNRNGKSDLQDYLDGNDPAACVWNTVGNTADTTVYHQDVLNDCLTSAGGDGKHNLIRIARGTYTGNFSYKSVGAEAVEAYTLSIIGGYAPDPPWSTERSVDPLLTVLQGASNDKGLAVGRVLNIDTATNLSRGKLRIEGLTIKNGKADSGGGIQARVYQGELELVGNIFTGNSADSGGGVSLESSDSASIALINNLVYGNTAPNASAVRIATKGAAVTLLNNTIVDNAATVDGDGRSILVNASGNASVDLTNNIISGTGGVTGKDLYINSGVVVPSLLVVMHNSLDPLNGLQAYAGFVPDPSNAVCDPQFADAPAGNYRLGSSSTCIDKGGAHAMLPEKDIAGSMRITGRGVDPGAYESPVSYYTLTGSVLSGNGAAPACDALVLSGTPASCTLAPAEGWYIAALTDNLSDVSGKMAGNSYHIAAMAEDHAIRVTYQEYLVRRVSGSTTHYHLNVQDAFDNAANNDTIRLLDLLFPGSVIFNRPSTSVELVGGYVSGFGSNPGYSLIGGRVDVRDGTVKMKNIRLR